MIRRIVLVGAVCACCAAAPAQQVYQSVPDQDKQFPVNPNDWSCWLAASANVLAGAGYGHAQAASPAARAQSVYSVLAGDIGTNVAGGLEDAVLYFLYNYGKNPDQPDWYQPANAFTDMTDVWKAGGLHDGDYNFLLGELARGQYAAVGLYDPNSGVGHAMTLVGGDYSVGAATVNSVWHDSDWDQSGTDDDFYYSQFTGAANQWSLAPIPPQSYAPAGYAEAYLTLTEGLNKPAPAVGRYDAAYFRDWDPNAGAFANSMRTAGADAPVFGQPVWMAPTQLRVPNLPAPQSRKSVYLLAEYIDRDPNYSGDPLLLRDDLGAVHAPASVQISPDASQALYEWKLAFEPLFVELLFPNDGVWQYYNLSEPIKAWNLATMSWRIGDVNEDQWVDPADIDLLHAYLGGGGVYDAGFDINGDGLLDGQDSAEMIHVVFGTEYGDATLDGRVTDADYTIWADNFGALSASWLDGDFNGDAAVTDADYTLWADHFGFDATVPVPSSLALLAGAGAALIRRRR